MHLDGCERKHVSQI